MKACGGVEVLLSLLLILLVGGGEWSASLSGELTPEGKNFLLQ